MGLLCYYILCHLHIIDQIFDPIQVRKWWRPFHYLLSGKSFMLKEFTSKLTYMRRSIVVNKDTLHFETVRLGFVLYKEGLVYKIYSTIHFNSFVDFEWSNNCFINNSSLIFSLLPPCCLLSPTCMSELDKIHPLAQPSCPSNVTQDSSVKITPEKWIFMYFWAQFWHFKIFASVRGERRLPRRFFYRSQFTMHSTNFVLFDSLSNSLFKNLSTD